MLATVDVFGIYRELFVESRQFPNIAPAFGASVGVTPFEFFRDFRRQKTRVPGLSCGVVCVILRLAVSVEHRPVTDGWTDTRRQLITVLAIVARVKIENALIQS